MNCPIALCTHKFYLLCKEECNQFELSSLCVFSILICSPLWKNSNEFGQMSIRLLKIEKRKKNYGPNRLIFILSWKKYTNGFCCRDNIFFSFERFKWAQKIVYNKGYRKNYSNIYIWDIADENSFALINRIRWMLKKYCPKGNKKTHLHKQINEQY